MESTRQRPSSYSDLQCVRAGRLNQIDTMVLPRGWYEQNGTDRWLLLKTARRSLLLYRFQPSVLSMIHLPQGNLNDNGRAPFGSTRNLHGPM